MTNAPERFHLAGASIRLDSMPVAGRDVDLAASKDERIAIAGQLGVTSVEALSVRLHAVKFRGGIRVTGRLTAEIVQPSVVTFEPVRQAIGEPIDRIFLPNTEKSFAAPAGAEIFVDLEGEDVPDHFDGPEADLTDLIVETLALAIDPYPRLEGESLERLGIIPEPEESPFAVLKGLKDKGPKGS